MSRKTLQMLKFLLLYLISILLFSCSDENSLEQENSVRTIQVENRGAKFIEEVEDYFVCKEIILPKKVADEIGESIDGFHYIDGVCYVSSTYTNMLARLTNIGTLEWIIKANSHPYESFSSANLIHYNAFSGNFEIYDPKHMSWFLYNKSGTFIGKQQHPLNFADRAPISSEKYIYDASDWPNEHLFSEDYKFYIYNKSSLENKFLKQNLRGRNIIPYTDASNFVRVGKKVFQKSNLSDTTFFISDKGPGKAAAVVNFEFNHGSPEILNDPAVISKIDLVMKNEFPYTQVVVPYDNYVDVVYRTRGKHYFTRLTSKGESVINSRFFKIGDVLAPSPYYYYDGTYFSYARADDRNALIAAASDDLGEAVYDELSQTSRDTEEVHIYIFIPKS